MFYQKAAAVADWRSADLLRPSLGEDDTTLTLLMAQTSFIAPNSRFAFLRGAVSRSIWTIGGSGQNRGRKESVDLHPRLAWEQNGTLMSKVISGFVMYYNDFDHWQFGIHLTRVVRLRRRAIRGRFVFSSCPVFVILTNYFESIF